MSDTTAGTLGAATLRPRKATAESLPTVSATLALAFYDDPVVMWCIPEGPRRRQILPGFFGAVAESYLNYDEIYDVDEGVSAAVWAPPGAEDDEHLAERIGEISAEYVDRIFGVLGLLEEKHPTDPHFYLFFLGTRREWQGRGIGSALMAPVLERCDREGVPGYLEATSERNKALYLRHGFEVTDEIRLPDGPSLWPMWRTPR
jgi:GNAT superfamily N-acetyltransferase